MTYKHVFPNSHSLTPEARRSNNLVSIITRTKNRPALLVRAVYSVLAQTHENWELIIVNDGGCRAEIETLLARFSSPLNGRLHLVHHATSQGMEAASNAGLKLASGDFVAIHDDDDAWDPRFLEETIKYLNFAENRDYAAVVTNSTVIFERIENGNAIELWREPWRNWREQADYKDLLCGNLFPPISLLVRKPVVDHLNGFNEKLPVLGDWDFILRLIQIGDIGTINRPLAYYYHREPKSDPGVYGNTVLAERSLHEEYNVKYRNSLMRAYASGNPGALGGVMTLIADLDARDRRLNGRIDRLEWLIQQHQQQLPYEIHRAAQGFNTILRVPRAIWRRMYPARRLIAQVRGRL